MVTVELPWLQQSSYGYSRVTIVTAVTMVTVELPWLQQSYHGYGRVTMVTVELPWSNFVLLTIQLSQYVYINPEWEKMSANRRRLSSTCFYQVRLWLTFY